MADRDDDFHDTVLRMADRLKLKGNERRKYVHDHMTGAGYRMEPTYVPDDGDDDDDDSEGERFFGKSRRQSSSRNRRSRDDDDDDRDRGRSRRRGGGSDDWYS